VCIYLSPSERNQLAKHTYNMKYSGIVNVEGILGETKTIPSKVKQAIGIVVAFSRTEIHLQNSRGTAKCQFISNAP
jgi:hypothetical protein